MIEFNAPSAAGKAEQYAALQASLTALLAGEHDFIANAANFTSLLYHGLPDLNWAGIYRWNGTELVLGPFQGRPACGRIAPGRGVCGTAAARRITIVVPDVHQFPGHIACDPASKSEVVVPLVHTDRLVGVLDLDSPLRHRFDAVDGERLEALAAVFLQGTCLEVQSR